MKIHEDSFKTFQVVERTRLRWNLVMVEVPWEIRFLHSAYPLMLVDICMKFHDARFLHSAYPLMLVDICMKFHDASLYGLKVIEQTRWRQDL